MIYPSQALERKLLKSGHDLVIAVDEVGVGCLAGPVVVCAISFTKEFFNRSSDLFHGLRDSKQLTPTQREKFAKELSSQNYKIRISYPKKIDVVNIYQATQIAMRRAIKNVSQKNSQPIILVDGNKEIKKLEFDQRAITKGDQKIFSIACASIIAKVYRDKMMVKYSKQFPAYGFELHKGYSTKTHQSALNKYGPCPIHRRSFRLIY